MCNGSAPDNVTRFCSNPTTPSCWIGSDWSKCFSFRPSSPDFSRKFRILFQMENYKDNIDIGDIIVDNFFS